MSVEHPRRNKMASRGALSPSERGGPSRGHSQVGGFERDASREKDMKRGRRPSPCRLPDCLRWCSRRSPPAVTTSHRTSRLFLGASSSFTMASQGAHPACLFLAVTLLVTGAATAILCTAILTNYWELITFDRKAVEAITARHNTTHTLTWLWEGKVGKVVIQLDKPLKVRRQVGGGAAGGPRTLRFRRQTSRVIYLVPHHGGIWTLCVGLSELEQEKLRGEFPLSGCINYLSPHSMGNSDKNDWVQSKSRSVYITSSCSDNSTRKDGWVQRMQNLSISCALVCCILLGASAVVGTFGIIQRQISAVLITGVMYILASTFGLFCLTIMHFKRRTKKDCGVLDAQVTPEYSSARVFETGWSLELGWGGVVSCLAAALLWLLLARIMRYNPISLS